MSLTDERSHDYTTTEDSQADKNSVSAKHVPPGGSEYLSGMMNANSPQGLVPKFPSWSLLSLGKYSSYSSTSGKDQFSLKIVYVYIIVDIIVYIIVYTIVDIIVDIIVYIIVYTTVYIIVYVYSIVYAIVCTMEFLFL